MEYKDDRGRVYEISYSQKLQKQIIGVGIALIVLCVIILILFGLILMTNFPSQFMRQLVC